MYKNRYSDIRNKFQSLTGMLEVSVLGNNRIEITNNLGLYVNREWIGKFDSIAECRRQATNYINSRPVIKESEVAYFIKEHTDVQKITTDIINKYIALIESKQFTLDEVVIAYRVANSKDKLTFVLEDNSLVSINPDTIQKIQEADVDFMKKSESNFIKTVRKYK